MILQTREIINLYEKLCEDFVTMREAEIKKLEKIFSELNGVEVKSRFKYNFICEYSNVELLKFVTEYR